MASLPLISLRSWWPIASTLSSQELTIGYPWSSDATGLARRMNHRQCATEKSAMLLAVPNSHGPFLPNCVSSADKWTFNCAVPSGSVARGKAPRIAARSAAKIFS